MKFLLALTTMTMVASATAFTPASTSSGIRNGVTLNAESSQSRQEFFSSFTSVVAGAALVGMSSPVNAMDQTNIKTPTTVWEFGTATSDKGAKKSFGAEDRTNLFPNARTQMNSNFPPIKSLSLEKKSPVTRLDINAPNFNEYKKTYPGLFTEDKNLEKIKAAAPVVVEEPKKKKKTEDKKEEVLVADAKKEEEAPPAKKE
mmetsp:Transcript_7486/g.8567  ORF Transcript_7486/g.8567 Transcript_7486/m.8567 type:complete len:201 (-) Transcript_7486:176-778(-)